MAEQSPESRAPSSGTGFDYRNVLRQMLEQNASDLHLKVGCTATLRVNGELRTMASAPMRSEEMKTLVDQLMPPRRQKELADFKETDFAVTVPGIGRFRVNAYQQRGAIACAFRIVPFHASTIPELNLPSVLEQIAAKTRGLVLVTGATGAGKSTALASMIQHVNQNRSANIITIEDPVEFVHRDNKSHVNQREIGSDTASFAQALRRVLRQDPDILMIGEIPDVETLDSGMKAADAGHLVLSTLHTADAAQTVSRILSFYPKQQQADARSLLASALEAIISLRLVPRTDETGRVPAAEVLINTPVVREHLRDTSSPLNIPDLMREGGAQSGIQSFDQSLMNWYKRGVISYESALQHATDPSEFALRIQGVTGASDAAWDNISHEATA